MLKSSKGLVGMVSAVMTTITALLVYVLADVTPGQLLVMAVITFVTGSILLFLFVESLFFRPLHDLRDRLARAIEERSALGEEGVYGATGWTGEITREINLLTEQKQREIERLKKLEAFRKDFIADVSHELKTPIFAAQGFVHTLLDGAVKEKAVRKKFLKKAARSLDGLDMLVQDLLTLSHIETGQIKMRFEEIDLYALTLDVFDQFKGKSDKKEIALRVEGPVRKVMVYADWQRIRQVMTNLISNAIKHSEEGGEVVVSFAIRKRSVVTRVRDAGEGIPPEHTKRIFERFYRVDKSRSREKGGTGLGLAIVKHILEGHDTVPEVESVPGKGSTFSFKLARFGEKKTAYGEDQQLAES